MIEGREVWTDNQDFGRRFFPPGLVRYPRSFTVPVAKAPNTLRIFVLGESAAMGDPDFKFGLPRMLEVLLRERYPERRIEVINAAMVAINSHVILPIARDCAARQGDLWVVYMGNNEMIGPFGCASVFGAQAPALPLVRAQLWLKSLRVGQLLDSTLYLLRRRDASTPQWAGMEMMASQKVAHDSAATARVYAHFERNLKDIVGTATGAGVPIVLCTVATNLKDCPPFASLHRVGLTAAELADWEKAFQEGARAQAKGDPAEAEPAYARASQIDSEFAELAFRRGQCALARGRRADAAVLFRQARDLDALQFRTDSRLNDILRHSATSFPSRRVSLLDAEELFATNSPAGIPGAEYFYEHVHLTPQGNYLLARAIADRAVKVMSLPSRGNWVPLPECLQLLGMTDSNLGEALEAILARVQAAPFTTQIDHERQFQSLKEQLARYKSAGKPAQVRRDSPQVRRASETHPDDPDLRWNLAVLLEKADDIAEAEAQWRTLIRLQPQASYPAFNLANLLEEAGRLSEALALYAQGLRNNPEYYNAWLAAGLLCMRMNRTDEALRHLEQAVKLRPNSVEPRLALARALVAANRPSDAAAQVQEILHREPDNVEAQAQLRELQTRARR